ncbi:hypothetical protein BIW11_12938 [Tropilaelaps mercedesae]|uniref:Uncharacterized protein n=1 Tax=Tropilaelaps mercedesae TaxID=418985 RepID=A0A1V9X4S8_9ACAR|nr:hypothetical protein BIW11_12938 [Tropilaelaps mercedesae]
MTSSRSNSRLFAPITQWGSLWCAMAALASFASFNGAVAMPFSSTGLPLNYRDIVLQQTPIRIIRCPQCETNALILATETDVSRVRKSGFSDQRLAEIEASLFNGSKMRRSGFSDQRIAEMEAMLMNSMKRPAQRALTASEQSR